MRLRPHPRKHTHIPDPICQKTLPKLVFSHTAQLLLKALISILSKVVVVLVFFLKCSSFYYGKLQYARKKLRYFKLSIINKFGVSLQPTFTIPKKPFQRILCCIVNFHTYLVSGSYCKKFC